MAYSFGSASTNNISCGTGVPQSINRTVAAWIKPNSANTARRMIMSIADPPDGVGVSENLYFLFDNGATNQLAFGFQATDTSYNQVTWTSGFLAGSTHLVIGTYDGSNLRIYADQDAAARNTQATSKTPKTGTYTTKIGNHALNSVNTRSFDGVIAELAYWTSVISAAERAMLGAGFSPMMLPTKPAAYWPLVRGLQDVRAGNNGTVTGATVANHPRIIYPSGYQRMRFAANDVVAPTGLVPNNNGLNNLANLNALTLNRMLQR